MPTYEFECNNCKEKFEMVLSIRAKESVKIVCPKCNSSDIAQIFSGINISTKSASRKSSGGCCGGSGCCG